MSSGSAELPPSLLLPARLSSIIDSSIESALEVTNFSESTVEMIRKQGWVALTGNEKTRSLRIPVSILGADLIEIDSIGTVNDDRRSGIHYVAADLFRDGSPYTVDQDLDFIDAVGDNLSSLNGYTFFTGHEIPVTAVNRNLLSNMNERDVFSISAMNKVRSVLGSDALRKLSEPECDDLLSAVESSLPAINPQEYGWMHGE